MTMPGVFGKMQLTWQREILVVGAPPSFEPALAALAGVSVQRDPAAVAAFDVALAFVTAQAEVDRLAGVLTAKAHGDALLWFAHPKGTSKRYRCDVNRDTGWHALHAAGFDTVRQVAIDADWSALRFRRTACIGSRARAR